MKEIRLKGKWGWAKVVVAGLIVGGSVATGAYFIYQNFASKNDDYISYNAPKEKKVFDELPLRIMETNPRAAKEDKKYFLSDEGLTKLKNRIETELNIGPEFYDLHSITIDDDNSIGDDANGNYYPQRDTINLSSAQYRKEGLPSLKNGDKENAGLEDIKVELLFQVLFHEYGHFIANKYLNSNSQAKNNIYTNSVNEKTPWDPDFLNQFETLMEYKPEHEGKPKLRQVPGQSWQSMGSIYSSADIYQRINYGNNQSFPEITGKPWKAVWAGTDPFFDPKKIKNGVDPTKLSYLWSMDEIYTRKYEQIFYPVNRTYLGTLNNYIKEYGGFHYYLDGDNTLTNNITPYTYDTSIYRDLGIVQNSYMADNPFNHKPELTSLMNRHEGRDKDISVMLYDKDGNFRIGGYTTDNEFTLSINGTKIESKVDEVPYLEEKNQKKYMWISNPIKPDNFIGKTISRITKDGSISPIKSVRHGADGTITTNRRWLRHNEYHLSYNTNKGVATATIEKGAGV